MGGAPRSCNLKTQKRGVGEKGASGIWKFRSLQRCTRDLISLQGKEELGDEGVIYCGTAEEKKQRGGKAQLRGEPSGEK